MTQSAPDSAPFDYDDYFFDQPGSMPGTLKIDEDAVASEITLIDYDKQRARRFAIADPEACTQYLETDSVSWINVQGLGNEDILRRLGKVFQLHPLVLEDVVNVPQRSKVEDYEDQLVIVARMVLPDPSQTAGFTSEQVSFILRRNVLLSVQERPYNDCFEPVRRRIRIRQGQIRTMGPDYLAYSLLDAIVDGFFPILEDYGEHLEDLEDEVLANPTQATLSKVHQVKRELFTLRRLSWSQRDALSALLRDDSNLVSTEVKVYLRDCYDHAIQVLEIVEAYREFAASLMDVYLSAVSNRMNEVMKILTVISTVFIPMSFISGLYGMNFNPQTSPLNMPELDWYWGYPMALVVMVAIATGLIYFFWRRGWFNDFSA